MIILYSIHVFINKWDIKKEGYMINIHKFYSEKINAITHVAPHHADEVFATVMLSVLFPVELLRTRDQEIIKNTKAIVYDVGSEYDPSKKRFDHHQKSFSEIRDDGINYSSAGLIWREYGASIVKTIAKTGAIDDEMTAEVVSLVDEALIRGIDARDNGQGEKGDSMSVSSVISACNSLWDENEDADTCFLRACDLATAILVREIKVAISTVRGRKLVADKIKTVDGPILVMDQFIGGWLEEVLNADGPKAAGLLFAIFPATNGDWNIQAIPPSKEDTMGQRKSFPDAWRGLKDEELIESSGVGTAVFCHKAGFFAVAKTKEDAIRLAEKAVNS